MKTLYFILAMTIAYVGHSATPSKATADKKNAVTEFSKLYCIVDLTKPNSIEWKDRLCVSDKKYKMTKLVLRRIEPGKFEYQPKKYIAITKPFYVGVFEVTQKQYELVYGNNPSLYRGPTRPVENISYIDVRGTGVGREWPKSNKVDGDTFIGKIRKLTGLTFDLPTEAQWSLACRGGVETVEMATPKDLPRQGKFMENGGNQSQHDKVGSFRPNRFGLYDMFGNVWEICLDKRDGYEGLYNYGSAKIETTTDPKGLEAGRVIVLRGASWTDSMSWATPNSGFKLRPDNRSCGNVGLRLCLTVEP